MSTNFWINSKIIQLNLAITDFTNFSALILKEFFVVHVLNFKKYDDWNNNE